MNRTRFFLSLSLATALLTGAATADTRILKSKVGGEAVSSTTSTNGDSFVTVKIDTPLIKSEFGDGAKIVTELGDQSTDTNLVVNIVDDAGDILGTLFDCADVTRVEVQSDPPKVRFFAIGEGVDSITHPVIGTMIFNEVFITGSIEYTSNGLPRLVKAVIHGRGDADDGEFIFTGKLNANNPFIASP